MSERVYRSLVDPFIFPLKKADMTTQLNLNTLEKALISLAEGLLEFQADTNNCIYRDANIHRFKICYELSHKILKRYLEPTIVSSVEMRELTFPELIRIGNERGLLLSSWERWKNYRTARSEIHQSYDESKAVEVMRIVPDFLAEGRALLEKLKSIASDKYS